MKKQKSILLVGFLQSTSFLGLLVVLPFESAAEMLGEALAGGVRDES